MIIFYPPNPMSCTPIVVSDMTDSSDQWSPAEITLAAFQNIPDDIYNIFPPAVFSCKYNYNIRHNGIPLGAGLKLVMNAAIQTPPADLVAQVSVGFVSSSQSIDEMADALSGFANPETKIMNACVIERTSSGTMRRSFVAYSCVLQPDPMGTTATLFISAASIDDTLIRSALGFQLDKKLTISAQVTTLALSLGYTCVFAPDTLALFPVTGRLFQPSSLPKILDDICLQNKLVYTIKDKIIYVYRQTSEPISIESPKEFSFLGYSGLIIWAAGIENYANMKFKTSLYDVALYDKITIWNDIKSSMFSGMNVNWDVNLSAPRSYDFFVIRYEMIRDNGELCIEVTSTNNWILAQARVEGIFETKIYEGAL